MTGPPTADAHKWAATMPGGDEYGGLALMQTEPSKSVDLRSRLLESAQQVFAVSGYASATVDDIITAAATSRATFYRYFRSKEDLFDELSRRCFLEMRALTKGLMAFDPAVDGRAGLEKLVSAYTRDAGATARRGTGLDGTGRSAGIGAA